MKRSIICTTLLCCASLSSVWAEQALDFQDDTTRINYSLGYQIGGDFKRQNIEMNAEAVVQGIRDALAGGQPQMPRPEMLETLRELKRKVVAEQQAQKKAQEEALLAAGRQFLEENAQKEGVQTTKSGLQYKVLQKGNGANPGPTDVVTVHYRGTKIDGSEFDSSFKRGKPATFKLNAVIKGWGEGLQLMQEGGKMQLFIPSELAYNRRGPLAYQTLIFEVELLQVAEPEAVEATETEGEPEPGKTE